MASKKNRTSKKTNSKTKTSSRKASTTRKKTARRSLSRTRTSKSASSKSRARQKKSARFESLWVLPIGGIGADRWLDITGIIMTLVGLLTLLSLLSPISSGITSGWISFIETTFGWGKVILPIGLIVCGTWLVLRKFERIPRLAFERVLGFILLFVVLLALMQFFKLLGADESAYVLAERGDGGGYIGAAVSDALRDGLGIGGAAIALLALFLIALALSFDVTIVEMVRWISPSFERFQDWMLDSWNNFRARRRRSTRGGAGEGGLTPITTDGVLNESHANSVSLQAEWAATGNGLPDGIKSEPRAWVLPPTEEILESGGEVQYDENIDLQRAQVIEESLTSLGAPARVVEINRGPTITQFGVEPDFIETRSGRKRVRVSKISALADDLALALAARRIRIQAPVPGKGYVGIEVPNGEISLVTLRDILENQAFKRMKSPLAFALGQNVSGNAVAADLAAMPHLLIAGATGAGKSVCVNALICCLLMNNTPENLRLIMVDPKRVELTGYNGIPHLLAPVVVELDRVVRVLQWVTREMDMRYRKLAEAGCRSVGDYNRIQDENQGYKLPYLVVIVDELADLMMIAPDETERTITRLAQLARATGIHLVISTQRPSVDVVTGLIKANFPARIAFAVASGVDSRVILDQPGAERLLGRGDMLFQAPDAPAPVRLQGVFVSDSEIQRLVTYWRGFSDTADTYPATAAGPAGVIPSGIPLKQVPMWDDIEDEDKDPLFDEAVDLCRRQGRASISMLQRRLRIGYTRAARLVETMEEKGIVGPPSTGTGAREILDYGPAAPPVEES
jgi:S-DNA-T family DNA segregation ATPase FtsK/SpoIIIE